MLWRYPEVTSLEEVKKKEPQAPRTPWPLKNKFPSITQKHVHAPTYIPLSFPRVEALHPEP